MSLRDCSRLLLTAFGLLALCCSPLFVAVSAAQDADNDAPALIQAPKPGTRPLAVVALSSLQKSREHFEALCKIAGYPETAEEIISRIDEATDTLAGIDKSRPGGVAVYLESVFPPSFEFVAFVPLSDIDAFMRTLELGPMVASPVAGDDSRYELLGPTETTQVRVENGYAFIQLPVMDPDEAFDRTLFDPTVDLIRQSTQFDVAVTLDVASIPKATRSLLLSFLTSTMSTQMQQRDDEAEGLYEMRRAWMQADIDGFKLLLDECQEITIGISVDPEQRLANIDFLIDVREGSDLLQEIFDSASRPSYFAPILNDDSAVMFSMSQVLAERDRTRYIGVIDGLRMELARQLTPGETNTESDDSSPVNAALTALQDTIQEGHIDFFGQCFSDSEGHLVVVAALRVLDGEVIADGLGDLLVQLQDMDGLETLQIGAGESAGIQFHRIRFDDPDAGRDAVLGTESGLVFGCGSRSFWFGLGGRQTLDTLGEVMDELKTAYERPAAAAPSSAFRMVVNVHQLIEMGETAGAANTADSRATDESADEPETPSDTAEESAETRRQRRRRRNRAAQAARRSEWKNTFAEGGDRIRIDFQPTKHGSRTRIELGEAFLKGIGRAITVTLQPPDQD